MKPADFVKLWSVWIAVAATAVLALEPHLPALQEALAPFPEWKAILPVLFIVARAVPQKKLDAAAPGTGD
jgi:hypothetical protein